MAKGLALPLEHGLVVADVEPDGPADHAGLKRKDVIQSLNGRAIQTWIRREFHGCSSTMPGNRRFVVNYSAAFDRF
jgi:C-terminal processing protease CtpA/Prc